MIASRCYCSPTPASELRVLGERHVGFWLLAACICEAICGEKKSKRVSAVPLLSVLQLRSGHEAR